MLRHKNNQRNNEDLGIGLWLGVHYHPYTVSTHLPISCHFVQLHYWGLPTYGPFSKILGPGFCPRRCLCRILTPLATNQVYLGLHMEWTPSNYLRQLYPLIMLLAAISTSWHRPELFISFETPYSCEIQPRFKPMTHKAEIININRRQLPITTIAILVAHYVCTAGVVLSSLSTPVEVRSLQKWLVAGKISRSYVQICSF